MIDLRTDYDRAGTWQTPCFEDEAQAELFFTAVTDWCIGKLTALKIKPLELPERIVMDWGRDNAAFPNMCAISQEIICEGLKQSGLAHRPFLSEAYKHGPFNHCATILPFTLKDSPGVERLALLDPTFKQFTMPSHIFAHTDIGENFIYQPAFVLSQTSAGRKIADRLIDKKWIVLDEGISRRYLNSLFCKDEFSPKQAMKILRHPPSGDALALKRHGPARIRDIVGTFPDFRALLTPAPSPQPASRDAERDLALMP